MYQYHALCLSSRDITFHVFTDLLKLFIRHKSITLICSVGKSFNGFFYTPETILLNYLKFDYIIPIDAVYLNCKL